MMRVKRWLMGFAMVVASLDAATAQNAGNAPPQPAQRSWYRVRVRSPSRSPAAVPRRPLSRARVSAATDNQIVGLCRLRMAAPEVRRQRRQDGDARSGLAAAGLDRPAARDGIRRPVMIDMETSSGGNPQDRLLWAVINLPPSTRLLAENTTRGRTAMLPAGAFQLSFLTNGYIGPLPGADRQAHHYLFELYTLNKMLDVPRDVTLDQLKAAIKGHQTGQRGVMVVKCCTDSK